MFITNNVAERRKELGITQMELSEAARIGRSTLSDIEQGRHIPGVDIALRLARALRCSVEDIFEEKIK